MQVQSLGYRTDLIFAAFDGQIVDRGDYLVVKTPSNPTFYWGNFLLFPNPPQAGDYARWQKIFAKEIGQQPEVKHQAMGWDAVRGESGAIQPFLDGGFHIEQSSVLTAWQNDIEPRSSTDFTIRALQTGADWSQAVENQVLSREPWFGEAGYRVFRQAQAQRYRRMIASGSGAWFGAFAGERLVGDLGIFCSQELARYQSVQTHPDYRRRGIAGSLVYHAARYAFEHQQVETLVIVAEPDSPAQRLYQAIGFQKTEIQMGVWKADEGRGEMGEQTLVN